MAKAGPLGFEPRSAVLETAILPLNYRPNAGKYTRIYPLRLAILLFLRLFVLGLRAAMLAELLELDFLRYELLVLARPIVDVRALPTRHLYELILRHGRECITQGGRLQELADFIPGAKLGTLVEQCLHYGIYDKPGREYENEAYSHIGEYLPALRGFIGIASRSDVQPTRIGKEDGREKHYDFNTFIDYVLGRVGDIAHRAFLTTIYACAVTRHDTGCRSRKRHHNRQKEQQSQHVRSHRLYCNMGSDAAY